jgi:hypothetical protein
MMSSIRIVLAAALLTGSLVSCSSPFLKAPPVATSSFLKSKPELKSERNVSPFALSGGTLVSRQQSIYIAPVSLAYLRAASKTLAKESNGDTKRNEAARELAEYAREKFIAAFEKSPKARYKIQAKQKSDCLTLELAIVELNRNTLIGATSRFVIDNLALPGTDAILAKAMRGLKGNIAIEGKVTDSRSGEVIYQFADNEESRSAFLLPITDLAAYGQAREAIRAWASQFEEISRVPPGMRVKDVGVMSLF